MKKLFVILAMAALASCGGSDSTPAADTTAPATADTMAPAAVDTSAADTTAPAAADTAK